MLGDTPLPAPVYRHLAERIRLLVVDGRLSGGVRMPSERDLAGSLSLSRTTVSATYAELRAAGYLVARQGSGHYVATRRAVSSTHLLGSSRPGDTLIGMTCASTSAAPGVAAAILRATERLPEVLAGSGYYPDGLSSLREALARWFTARGLPTGPDQLIVTAGALSALNIVARAVLTTSARVLVESPTYPPALTAIRSTGARLVAAPLTSHGWVSDHLAHVWRQSQPAMAYLMPDFQNPTGALMSDETRAVAAASARRHGTTLVVDETLVELALDPLMTPKPMGAHAKDAITIGSASKAFWGGLRLGWIRAPRGSLEPLIECRAAMDLGAAPFEQLVLDEILKDPAILLTEQRARLVQRRGHLRGALQHLLPDWLVNSPAGGMSLWVQLPNESSSRLATVAELHGVAVTPGPVHFAQGGGERYLRLPFSSDLDVLTESVRRLSVAWADLRAHPVTRAASNRLRLTA